MAARGPTPSAASAAKMATATLLPPPPPPPQSPPPPPPPTHIVPNASPHLGVLPHSIHPTWYDALLWYLLTLYQVLLEPLLCHLNLVAPGFGDPTYGRASLPPHPAERQILAENPDVVREERVVHLHGDALRKGGSWDREGSSFVNYQLWYLRRGHADAGGQTDDDDEDRGGGGGADVALVHGINGYASRPPATPLALARRGFRAVCIDLPSFGNSSGLHAYLPSMRIAVEAVHAVLCDLARRDREAGRGAPRSTFLLGESMGGFVTLYYSAIYPPLIPHDASPSAARTATSPAVADSKRSTAARPAPMLGDANGQGVARVDGGGKGDAAVRRRRRGRAAGQGNGAAEHDEVEDGAEDDDEGGEDDDEEEERRQVEDQAGAWVGGGGGAATTKTTTTKTTEASSWGQNGGRHASELEETTRPNLAGVVCVAPMIAISQHSLPSKFVERIGRVIIFFCGRLPFVRGVKGNVSTDVRVEQDFLSDPKTYKGWIRIATGYAILQGLADLQRLTPRIRVPVAIHHGTHDRATDYRGSVEFMRRVGSEDKLLRLWEGGEHALMKLVKGMSADDHAKRDAVLSEIVAWCEAQLRSQRRRHDVGY